MRPYGVGMLRFAAANMCLFIGIYLCQAVAPLLARQMGGGAVLVGWVGTSFFLGTVVMRIPAGWLHDRFGRAGPLLGGAVLCALSAGLLATARTPLDLSLYRAGQGIGLALFTTAVAPAVAAVAGQGRLTRALSVFGISTNVAAAIGPAAGIALLSRVGPAPGFVAAAVACGMAGVLAVGGSVGGGHLAAAPAAAPARAAAGAPTAAASPAPAPGERVAWPLMAAPLVAAGAFGVTYAVHATFVPVIGAERAIPAFGLYYTTYAVAIVGVRLWAGRVGDRFGHVWMVVPGAICGAAAWVLLGSATSLPALLAAAILYAVAGGAIHPACLAALIARAPASRRGTASAAFYLAYDGGNAVGGPAVGAMIQAASVPAALDLAAAVGLVGALAMALPRARSLGRRRPGLGT